MEQVLAVFTKTDAAGNGFITRAALGDVFSTLGAGLTEAEVDALFHAAGGSSSSGCVSYQGFCDFLDQQPGTKAPGKKPMFFDMKHSNNAARIRLWLMLKEGAQDMIETKTLTYPELKSPEFAKINPLKKVPGLVRSDGVTVFESFVILEYLEDKYRALKPSFMPLTAENRQLMQLMIRCHDLYIASPNCTAPGFSHSQGSMYLSHGWHGEARGMDLETRAAKLEEIWKQLTWLNGVIVGPYLVGDQLTLADMTWFPTTIFMEFMLPRVFGWPDIFREMEGPFPAIAKWWTKISQEPAFAKVRGDIWDYWVECEEKGQFKYITDEIAADQHGLKFKYP